MSFGSRSPALAPDDNATYRVRVSNLGLDGSTDSNGSLLQVFSLPVITAYEKVWKAALLDKLRADKIGNVSDEQRLDFGRADIVTEKEVYEIDRYDKFHQGIGQTLHYSMVLKKPAVLALMLDKTKVDPAKTAFIEKLCKHHKIRLVLLKAEEK